MAIKIKFDPAQNPEKPTFVLGTRSGQKIGELFTAQDEMVQDNLTSASEISLTVYKELDGVELPFWDDITALKLIWVKEWDKWFQIDIDTEQTTETVKHITGTSLSEAELSQIYLYNIEINTEDDILNDDYTVTVLYDPDNPKGSLLNRLLADKAPHYTITHVDSTIAKIQRSFSFDNTTILDAFYEIAEEIGCIFIFDSGSNEDGSIARTIKVYDLKTACMNDNCEYYQDYSTRYRASSMTECPKCGSTNLLSGYGEDTTIFVSNDNLSDDITKTPDTDSLKNCFKLVAGDDLMTSVIMSCNPAGTQYIWNIPESMRSDMSAELQAALETYDALYYEYQNTKEFDPFDEGTIANYNKLITKYSTYDGDLTQITLPIVGFSGLTEILYDLIDFELLLQTSLMPDTSITESSVEEQVALIESMVAEFDNIISLSSISSGTSQATTESSLKLLVRSAIDTAGYSFEIVTKSFSNTYSANGAIIWTGYVIVTSEIENDDGEYNSASTSVFTLTIDDDYQNYIEQLIYKTVSSDDTEEVSITGLFSKDGDEFTTALTQYSLDNLEIIYDCCQGVLDVLLDYGAGETTSEFYDVLYHPYYVRLQAIASEMDLRDSEIGIIQEVEEAVDALRTEIADALDFEANLGETLWAELCAYRREDTYENSNYISDGLTNAELVSYALQFLERAEEELLKASTLQHTISTTLHNLLVIPEFSVLVDYFSVGNWIRVEIDGEIYRLRLESYEIDYNDLTTIQVDFSDVEYAGSLGNDLGSLFSSMSAVATSYDSTKHQVSENSKLSKYVSGWVNDGLDITNTNLVNNNDNQYQVWDEHGLLLKKYNAIVDDYEDTQMKLVNRGLYLTDDNWETVKTAVGLYWYNDPETGELTSTYGIMADTIIGELILGENLGIYNNDGKLSFDENGLVITNGVNTFAVDPSSDRLFMLSNADGAILYVDSEGNLQITASSITSSISGEVESQVTKYTSTSVKTIAAEFTISSSSTKIDDDSKWSADTPVSTVEKPYIWMRSVYTYGDGTVVNGEPVCISGEDGTTILSSSVTYQIGTSGESVPSGAWSSIMPEVSQGEYLWTKTEVSYSDGTSTVAYSVGYFGNDITVVSYSVEYQTSTDGTTPPTGEWDSSVTTKAGSFVWTRIITYYSDGATTISYSVSYIGQDGNDGRGVTTVTEYYAVSSSAVTAPTSWYTSNNMPEMDETNKFLWNYESVLYSDGGIENTDPVIIGAFGAEGVGISSVEEYYAVSANATTTPSSSQFSTKIPTMTATNKYLWNYEVINYTDGSTQTTSAVVIGAYGDSTTSLVLTASAYVVGYDETGTLKDSTAITLEAVQQNYSDEITWSAVGSSSGKITLSGTGTTRTLDVSNFNTNDSVVVTISAGDLSDTVTIVKIQDGGDSVNIILTNEAHTFAGTYDAAIASSTTTEVVGYIGTTQTAVTIGTISGCPNGMTYEINKNGEIGTNIIFNVSSSMTTKSGTVTIPCTCGEVSIDKIFSYSLALKGEDGEGIGIESITEWYLATSKDSSVTTSESGWTTDVTATSATLTATNKYLWNYETIYYTDGTDASTAPIIIGAYGKDGNSIKSVTEYYLVTSKAADITTSTSGWTTDPSAATMTATNKYLWNYEKILYSDGTSSSTAPVIIGAYGDTGDTGIGISAYAVYYYVTTGTTNNDILTIQEPTDPNEDSSGWSLTQPSVSDSEYLWISYKITYTDGSVYWTSPTMLTDISTRNDYVLIKKNYNEVTSTLEEYSRILGETDKLVDEDGNVVSITEKFSLMEQTADALTLKVESQTEAIDNISVGGRNLILDSEEISATRTDTTNNWLSELVPFMTNSDYGVTKLQAGGTFTLSFDYEITGVTTAVGLTISLKASASTFSTGDVIDTLPLSVGNNSGHYSCTFTPTEEQMEYGTSWILSHFGVGSNEGTVVTLRHVKFETGNTETDWTPAPEDTESALSTVQDQYTNLSLTVDGITTEIGNLSTTVSNNYTTLSDKITTVESTADGISATVSALTTTVSDNYTALSNRITTVETTADGITASVSSVQSQLDNLSIGGRNLILDSEEISATRTNTDNNYLSELVPFMTNSDYGVTKLQAGGTFTLSFDYEITGVTTAVGLTISLKASASTFSTGDVIDTLPLSVGNNSGHYSCTFTPTEEQMEYGTSWILSHFGVGSNEGTVVTLRHVKFETGNTETDWTPAPEDTEEQISEVTAKLALTIETDTDGNSYGCISANADYIQFDAGQLVVNSDNFTLTGSGIITANEGTIGPLTITNSSNTDASTGHYTKTSVMLQNLGVEIDVNDVAGTGVTETLVDMEWGMKSCGTNLDNAVMYLCVKNPDDKWSSQTAPRLFYVTGNGQLRCCGLELYPNLALDYNEGVIELPDDDIMCAWTDDSALVLHTVKFTGQAVDSDIDPSGENTYDLGGSLFYWRRVYCGTIYRTSESSLSDRKLKQDIEPLDDNYTDFIMGLNPVSYAFKNGDSHRKHLGFIAQDVRDTVANTVGDLALVKAQVDGDDDAVYEPGKYTDDQLTWCLSYDELISPMVKMIQDMRREVDELKQRIKEVS